MNKVLFSKESDNWKTPTHVYNHYISKGYFDPCPYMSEFDGLEIEWEQYNFVNPPYSKIKKFVDKAIEYINSTDFIYDRQYKKKDKLENILNVGDE